MIKIRRHKRRSVPTLNMASMPDLIFTVLFFFMIVTHMRTETPRLKLETPHGTELSKPTNKRTLVNLYIGTDSKGETHCQIGSHIIPQEKVAEAILLLHNKLNDEQAELFTVNIRADKKTSMGIISDIKQDLRRAGILNIRYSAIEERKK